MSSTTETIVINGTKDVIEKVCDAINSQPRGETVVTERRNLDGNVADWILVASFAQAALPHVLGFIKEYLGMKQVRKIKVGDIEIENPTPEDIDRFRTLIDSRVKGN